MEKPMKNGILCLIMLLVLNSNILCAGEGKTILCISDATTGFHYKNEKWNYQKFFEKKFLIRKIKPSEKTEANRFFPGQNFTYSVSQFGNDHGFIYCPSLDGTLEINCWGEWQMFRYNMKNGRFLYAYLAGYIEGDNADNSPNIAYGKCSAL
jgi:hypothetical protein